MTTAEDRDQWERDESTPSDFESAPDRAARLALDLGVMRRENESLRAKVARVEELRVKWADQPRSARMSGNGLMTTVLAAAAADLGDALAGDEEPGLPDGGPCGEAAEHTPTIPLTPTDLKEPRRGW